MNSTKRIPVLATVACALVLGAASIRADEMKPPPAAPVNATFQRMKSLVGNWKGTAGHNGSVSYTLVADGSALMERLTPPAPEPEMISMYAPDGDGVMMTHYCSMHNQPRMRASASPSGAIEFKFVDATNLAKPSDPHMDHVILTMPAGAAFSQEWFFQTGDKVQSAVFSYTKSN